MFVPRVKIRSEEGGNARSSRDAPSESDDDAIADYVEYRSVPELSQIQISTGVVRGEVGRGADEAASRQVCQARDLPVLRQVRRGEGLPAQRDDGRACDRDDPHDRPAAAGLEEEGRCGGADEQEPTWVRRVMIRIDGHKKFNCSIGDSPTDELIVYGISIYPEDGTCDAAASDFDGYELTLPRRRRRSTRER